MAYGIFLVGDGSGGGGGQNLADVAAAGGAGGGNNDTLTGSSYNDVIFGDGSGGGGGGIALGSGGSGGLGGGGADTLYGGFGNDILFGDGFNGSNGDSYWGGAGGFGGGGGGGGTYIYSGGAGGLGAGDGGTGYNAGGDSMVALKDGFGSYTSTGAPPTSMYGGGGGGFGDVGNGGYPQSNGAAGGTSVYSRYDNSGTIYDTAYYHVTAGHIYDFKGTTNGYGGGNDILDGGAGSDHYFGMGGANTYIVSAQDNASTDIDTIWDFHRIEGDMIQLEDESGNLLTTDQVNTLLDPSNGKINLSNGSTTFTMSDGSQLIIIGWMDLTAADFIVACFLPGTRFETANGMKAIEELQIGEMMKTAHGYTPLKWLAKRHVDWSMSIPRRVAPVLVKQGALGNNLPLRDLHVSPAHAFEIDGVLINAELLVNGSTIVQLLDYDRDFTYFNIELDTHAIVYAEGAAVESYLEVGDNRNSYDNAAEFHALYPHHVVPQPMEMGRITLKLQLPSLRKAAA